MRRPKAHDDIEWPEGAVAMTKNLDLLKDEPLELAVALRKLAEKRARRARATTRSGRLFRAGDGASWWRICRALNQPSRAA